MNGDEGPLFDGDSVSNMPVEVFEGVEDRRETFRSSPILNTPSFKQKLGRVAGRNSHFRLKSVNSRSSVVNVAYHSQSQNLEVPTTFQRDDGNSTISNDQSGNQVADGYCSDSEEDLFATAPSTTMSVNEQMVPCGLRTLLGATEPSNLSWTSSMASPLTGNVTYSNLNTEERKILLPNEGCSSAKPRVLFSPDPNDTVDCQLLNVSSDLDSSHALVGKTPARIKSSVPKRFPQTSFNTSSQCEDVTEDYVSKPGYEFLDALCSPVRKPKLKRKCASGGSSEVEMRKERRESPVLSGSSRLKELSSVKKLYGEDQGDPPVDYCVTSFSANDNVNTSKQNHSLQESTPTSSTKRNVLSDSISITSTPNGNASLVTEKSSLKDASTTLSAQSCESNDKKLRNSPTSSENVEDTSGILKRKRLIFTSDLNVRSQQDSLGFICNLTLAENAPKAAENLSEFSIPDDSLMEHLANMNTNTAPSPKTKVLAIKNSYSSRNFCYSSDGSSSNKLSPSKRLKSPLKEILSSANALESIMKLETSKIALTSTKELVAFNKFKEPSHIKFSCDNEFAPQNIRSSVPSKAADMDVVKDVPVTSKRKFLDDVPLHLDEHIKRKKISDPSIISPAPLQIDIDVKDEVILTSAAKDGPPVNFSDDKQKSSVNLNPKPSNKMCTSYKTNCNKVGSVDEFSSASGLSIPDFSAAFQKSSSNYSGLDGLGIGDMKGFCTARGQSVLVSNAALQKAKKIFEGFDENQVKSCEDAKGLSIASGVSVPNAALQKTQETFESFDCDQENSTVCTKGFSTASGKVVPVSSAALHKAQKIFKDLDGNQNTSIVDMDGFSTVCGSNETLSSATFQKPKKISNGVDKDGKNAKVVMKGFSTASGQSLSVSNAALQKVQKIFAELDDDGKNTVKDKGVFSTASGESVSVSSDALQNAKRIFESLDGGGNTASQDMKGFSTASGLSISVSNTALQKAQEMFQGLEGDQNSSTADMKVVLAGNGQSVLEANAGHQKTHMIFEDVCKQEQSSVMDMKGFSTANGRSVTVSAAAVRSAARIFGDFDEQEMGSVSEKPETACCKISSVSNSVEQITNSVLDPSQQNQEVVKMKKKLEVEPTSHLDLTLFDGVAHALKNSIEHTGNIKDSDRSRFHFPQSSESASSLFIDDGFFNDSESMNAISNVMASITTSPSMVSDRFASLQPILSSDNQEADKSSEPTSPILSKSGPRKRPRKGRLSLTSLSSSRPTSPLICTPMGRQSEYSFPSNTRTSDGNISNSVENRGSVEDCRSSCEKGLHLDASLRLRKNVEKFQCETFPEEQKELSSSGTYSVSYQPFIDSAQDKNDNCRVFCDFGKISHNSMPMAQIDGAHHSNEAVSMLIGDTAHRGSCSKNTKTPLRPPLKSSELIPVRSSLSHTPDVGCFGVKQRRSSSNIYSFVAWPSQELTIDEKKLRPEVAELRKRAAEEQKELVENREEKGKALHPCVGSLLSQKMTLNKKRISWNEIVDGVCPARFSREQLMCHGIRKSLCSVTAGNAAKYRFSAWDFYSADVCRENVSGIPVGDGALLVLDSCGEAGVLEIERAFLASPGVDPSLVPPGWILNHYRWIVWKLAAMERSFPQKFGGQCLTPHILMQQLKYRYDREIDRCERSALRRILEHDDSVAKRLVLCVADIVKRDACEERSDIELEMTDGWYSVIASIDSELQQRVSQHMIKVGTKLITHGAELLNCSEGCSPLEVRPDVRLRLISNSTRRARWFTKLGFHINPGPISIRLHSILGSGGVVSSVTAHIARIYPILFLEKKGDKTVVRSERAEFREAAIREQQRQQLAEQVLSQIRADVFKEQDECKRFTLKQPSHLQVTSISSGEELFELLNSASDPVSVQCMMTHEQLMLVEDYRRVREDCIRQKVETRVKQKFKDDLSCERQVTPLLKVRLVDSQSDGRHVTAILSIWRPSEEVVSVIKEGLKVTVMGSIASGFRCGELQLSANRSTRYKMHGVSGLLTDKLRVASPLIDLISPSFVPNFGELDIVGVVICVGPLPKTADNSTHFQTAYLADSNHNIVGISFWGGIKEFAFEDTLACHAFVAASNLQWRGSPVVRPLPCIFASELTSITTKPRLPHLQHALQELRESMPSDEETFLKVCEEKLEHLLSQKISSGLSSRKLNTHRTDKTPGRTMICAGSAADVALRPQQISSPRDLNLKIDIDHQKNTPSRDFSPNVEKRLAKLDLYGEPPPLSPIIIGETNRVVRRSFQAPRRINDALNSSHPISTVTNKR